MTYAVDASPSDQQAPSAASAPGKHGLSARQRALIPLMRALGHTEIPSYGHMLNRLGLSDQAAWANAPTVEIRGRMHKYLMRLDLADFFQRIAFFFGTYHELDVLSAIDAAVRPGDEIIDGGANIGLVSLHMCRRVGHAGTVHSFEPNPALRERLEHHLDVNRLAHVWRHHYVGLSDREASLELRLPGYDNVAAGTFADAPQRYGEHVTSCGVIKVLPGDSILEAEGPPLFIKLDVEGFETKALRGMERAIENRKPMVIAEVNTEMLEQAGSSADEVLGYMHDAGYRVFGLNRRGFRGRHKFTLHPLRDEHVPLEQDAVFLHPAGPHWARLAPIIAPPGRYWRHIRHRQAARKAAKKAGKPGVEAEAKTSEALADTVR